MSTVVRARAPLFQHEAQGWYFVGKYSQLGFVAAKILCGFFEFLKTNNYVILTQMFISSFLFPFINIKTFSYSHFNVFRTIEEGTLTQ